MGLRLVVVAHTTKENIGVNCWVLNGEMAAHCEFEFLFGSVLWIFREGMGKD